MAKTVCSLLELLDGIAKLTGSPLERSFREPRAGDQPVLVCDISSIEETLGWQPRTNIETGIRRLFKWVVENQSLFL